jgi:hypothetical protein
MMAKKTGFLIGVMALAITILSLKVAEQRELIDRQNNRIQELSEAANHQAGIACELLILKLPVPHKSPAFPKKKWWKG